VAANERKFLRCAVYTRKSSEHGLEQDFNSLDAQREAAEAYIKSQAHEGWRLVKTHYDDGGLSGGTLERPECRLEKHFEICRKFPVFVENSKTRDFFWCDLPEIQTYASWLRCVAGSGRQSSQ